jgi:cytochrome c2
VPYVSARAGAVALLVFAAALFAASLLYDKIDDRSDLRTHAAATVGGNPSRGEAMFIQYGCGSCHKLTHVRKATGMVGPPLDGVGERAIIAGKLDNSPENLQRWIRDPQLVTPGTAMPNLNVGAGDARDISAFLYTRTG